MGIAPPDNKEPVTPPAAPPANPPATPHANPPANPPAAPPPAAPPTETAEQKAERLEKALKEEQARNGDLSTTIATIEQRQRDLDAKKPPAEDEIEKESKEIAELMLTDPSEAARRNAALLRKISHSASQMAQSTLTQQAAVEKIKQGVKSANPDFDDDTVDYIMERADRLAGTGKFKTADEAVQAAVTLVKSKFDGYAQKRNATPPLPPGAVVETGGNPPPAAPAKDAVLPTAAEELAERKDALQKKIL